MNKFKKILVTILVLITALTFFTVVALAADDAPEKEKKQAVLLDKVFNNETYSPGDVVGANPNGVGHYEIAKADNGNKYVLYHHSAGTGNAGYFGMHYQSNETYSLYDYPYLAIDFDIAKASEEYANFTITGIYYHKKAGNGGSVALTLGSLFDYFPKNEFEWAHVTVIFRYTIIDGTRWLSAYVYVNGEQVYYQPEQTKVSTQESAAEYYFGTFRIGPAGSVSTEKFTAFDNSLVSFYNGAYTPDEVANYIYNENYELPYGVTVATIGNQSFDSLGKAVEAANSGDVIKLVGDINETVIVDKSVVIDTNKYGEDKNPTGEYYKISTTSNTLASETVDGIIVFKQVQNASVEIFWDDCPGVADGGECTCDKEYLNENGEHIMAYYIPSAMLNGTPVYPGEIPVFPAVNGVVKEFVGWSYTQGGKAEELKPISPEDVERGYISLYPVYSIIKYDFEVVTSTGASKFFLESEYTKAIEAISGSGTLILHDDVTVEKGITVSSANAKITIDLNGHDFRRFNMYSTHYKAVPDGNGGWTKGDAITDGGSPVISGEPNVRAFTIAQNNIEFTIKTSVPGANIYTYTVSNDAWINPDTGEAVKYDNAKGMTGGSYLFYYQSAKNTTVSIQGKGLSYYGGCIVSNEWGTNADTNTFIIDGGSYYKTVNISTSFISIRAGGVLDVKNATFVTNKTSLVMVRDNLNNDSKLPVKVVDFKFTNCTIIGGQTDNTNETNKAAGIKFVDCCYYVTNASAEQKLTFGSGNYINDFSYANAVYSANKNTEEVEKSFWVVAETSFTLENGMPTFVFTPEKQTYTFTHNTCAPETDYTTVTFKNTVGSVISELKVLKNTTVTAPNVPLGDGWRAVTNASWNDASGSPASLALGSADSYEFTAVLPEEADREYTADLSVAMLGMSLYSDFKYNLYVPKVDKVTVTLIGAEAPANTVMIAGNEYYVYSVYADFADAINDAFVTVKYTIDGEDYEKAFAVSAYVYAMQCVDASAVTSEAEKEAAAALIRYIEEAEKTLAKNNILSVSVLEKFEQFYAKRTPAAYVTEYPDTEKAVLNTEAVKGIIDSVYFSFRNGSRMELTVTLTGDAVNKGYKAKITSAASSGSHDDLVSAVYTVSILDADGNAVSVSQVEAKTDYSIVTYILAMEAEGVNVDVAKAFYAFAKAVSAVKPVA